MLVDAKQDPVTIPEKLLNPVTEKHILSFSVIVV